MSVRATFTPSRNLDDVRRSDAVSGACLGVAEQIVDDAADRMAGSSTLRPGADRLFAEETETGARAGSTWGPMVPVEFGTIDTPPHRVLTGAAEGVARRTGGRFEP